MPDRIWAAGQIGRIERVWLVGAHREVDHGRPALADLAPGPAPRDPAECGRPTSWRRARGGARPAAAASCVQRPSENGCGTQGLPRSASFSTTTRRPSGASRDRIEARTGARSGTKCRLLAARMPAKGPSGGRAQDALDHRPAHRPRPPRRGGCRWHDQPAAGHVARIRSSRRRVDARPRLTWKTPAGSSARKRRLRCQTDRSEQTEQPRGLGHRHRTGHDCLSTIARRCSSIVIVISRPSGD